jgi:hypothetical protein
MRKVYVDVTVRLIINQDDGVETSKVINEMEYNFMDMTGKATIEEVYSVSASVIFPGEQLLISIIPNKELK